MLTTTSNKRRKDNDHIRRTTTTTTITTNPDRRNKHNKQQRRQQQQQQQLRRVSSSSSRWQIGIIKILMIIIGFISFLGFFFLVYLSEVHNNDQHDESTFNINLIMKPAPPPRRRHSKNIMLPLTAYIEEPMRIDKPLPIRKKPNLRKITYGTIQSCHNNQDNNNNNIQDILPVDHPIELDNKFGPNVGTLFSLYSLRQEYANISCPVDADPFLPWIHDVFLNTDGTYVEFIAHNKRRCRSDPSSFMDDLTNLEPQIAIMQSVSVKRIIPDNNNGNNSNYTETTSYRYRLASIEEADDDGRETRFICQFHTPIIRNNNNNDNKQQQQQNIIIEKKILAETLSVFPYNYEHANYRKGGKRSKPMLTRPKDSKDIHGTHNENVWNSIIHFRCPVPDFLKDKIIKERNNNNDNNNNNMIYIDLVPIRTPARETNEGYNPQLLSSSSFNATEEWGTNHILPSVEDSGRWSNIPICPVVSSSIGSSTTTTEVSSHSDTMSSSSSAAKITASSNKSHYLIGCLWASAEFSTRGDSTIDKSTSVRLLEWIVYNLYIVKMDHIYVYDNTRAFVTNNNNGTSSSSLKKVLDIFPSDRVTRIPWKHRVCNNNRPMHKNSGERSSQYAAETSCRVRYGPTTEWLAQLDVDEYLIPAGQWTDIQSWLKESVMSGKIENNTNILSFFQTRAMPNIEFMESCNKDDQDQQCLMKRDNITFLQAYDCERTMLPKPDFGWRAKKQIYRPNYVLNHFIHYSTVTQRIHEAPKEDSPPYNQRRPYERRVDELEEAFMLHTKTTYPSATKNWVKSCKGQSEEDRNKCPVGIAYSLDSTEGEDLQQLNTTKAGFACNCYQHQRIQNDLAAKLQNFLQPFLNSFHLN
jgi:hypothetical protein